MTVRSCQERRQHVEEILAREDAHVWVSTADARGARPHLIPMSYAALDGRVLLCTSPASPTGRNLLQTRTAKLAFGQTDDVVLVTAGVESCAPWDQVPQAVREQFASQSDWDPSAAEGDFHGFVLAPDRIDVWGPQEENEGRNVMRAGEWRC